MVRFHRVLNLPYGGSTLRTIGPTAVEPVNDSLRMSVTQRLPMVLASVDTGTSGPVPSVWASGQAKAEYGEVGRLGDQATTRRQRCAHFARAWRLESSMA